jgi:hypothetical protein
MLNFIAFHPFAICVVQSRTQDTILSKYFRLPLHVPIPHVLNSQRSANDGVIEQYPTVRCVVECGVHLRRDYDAGFGLSTH